MAYHTELAERIREILADKPNVDEKVMFSGIAFLVNDKLCICVRKTDLMCRIDPSQFEELVHKNGVQPMVMKGKEMKGYVLVNADRITDKRELCYWVNLCLAFNPHAKSSKKKKLNK